MRDILPGIALKESMGSRRHLNTLFKPIDRILKSKLKNIKKNCRYQKCNYRPALHQPSPTDTLFKTLKGEMVTTLNQQHIPIQAK